jgi:DUF1365 family protein
MRRLLRIAPVETAKTSVAAALTPAIYPTRVTHLHRSPVQHYGEHRSYSWYVDVDELPRMPRMLRAFARFDAADHFDGPPETTLRQRVDAILARNGVFIPGGRVTALLTPRVLGRAFSPLSLFWCHDAAGAVRCVVAEVQDTRGKRSAYVLPAAEDGPMAVSEELRNAPFAADEGYFLVWVPRPADTLDLTISLHRDNHAALVATWRGARRPVSPARVLLLQITHPFVPQTARLRLLFQQMVLRWHGHPAAARPVTHPAERPARTPVRSAASGWGANTRSWAPS